MALFGKKDEGIYLLNQFLQLEIDQEELGYSEIVLWAVWVGSVIGTEFDKQGAAVAALDITSSNGTLRNHKANLLLGDLAALQPVTRRVFNEIVATSKVDIVSLESLNDWLGRTPSAFLGFKPVVSGRNVGPGEIACVEMDTRWNSIFHPLHRVIAQQIIWSIQTWNERPDLIRQCPVCLSPFVAAHRSDQVRCSKRCNDRAAMRRRRSEIKSNPEKMRRKVVSI